MKRSLYFFALALSVGGMLVLSQSAGGDTITNVATQDVFAQYTDPNPPSSGSIQFNTAQLQCQWRADNQLRRDPIIRFDITDLPVGAEITGITLRLWAIRSIVGEYTFYSGSPSSWVDVAPAPPGEVVITPSYVTYGAAVGSFTNGTVPANVFVEYPVDPSFLSTNGSYTLIMKKTQNVSNSDSQYATSENADPALRPTLIVEFESGAPLTWVGDGSANAWNTNSANMVWTNAELSVATNFNDGDKVTFDDSSANTTVNIPGTVVSSRITITNIANDFTFSGGTIAGGKLIKQGLGTLTLSSVTPAYTGGTTIEEGTLAISSVANITLAGLSGSGTLTKSGSGQLTVSGGNSFAGSATVQAGTLEVLTTASGSPALSVDTGAGLQVTDAAAGTTLVASSLTFASGSTSLRIDDGTVSTLLPVISTANLTNSGTVTVNYSATTIAPGPIALIDYDSATSVLGSFANPPVLPVGYTGMIVTNAANSSIDLVITGIPAKIWSGTLGDLWDIGTTANWNPGAATYADGDLVRFDDTGANTAINVNNYGAVAPGLMYVTNSTKTYSFLNGTISTPVLVKEGSGVLSLQSAGNTFSSVDLRAGTMSYDITGTAGGVFTGGGTLQVAGSATTLTLGGSMGGFQGPVSVLSGNTLKPGGNNVLGTPDAGTTIANGATLDINGTQNRTEPVTVSGAGADSFSGAIINTGAAQQNALADVTLTGDTTFGGTGRWDIRAVDASIANAQLKLTGAYKITKAGANQVSLVSVDVSPLLGDIEVQDGTFSIENTTSANVGNPNNTIRLSTYGVPTTLATFNGTAGLFPAWNKKIALSGDATISKAGGQAAALVGTVDLGFSTLTLNCTGGSLFFSNVLSGASANVVKIGNNDVSLLGANTYGGTTTVSNGLLKVSTASSVTGTYTVNTGASLGARLATVGGKLTLPTLTLGGAGGAVTLVFDLATFGGSPTVPVLEAGTLTANAATYNVTVQVDNLSGLNAGKVVLFKYPAVSGFTNDIAAVTLPAGVVGTVINNTTLSQVELTITSVSRNLTWMGVPTPDWNINTTANWVETGTTNATTYKEIGLGDNVAFTDTASNFNVNLTTTVSPAVMEFTALSNNYTIGGAGGIAGPVQVRVVVGAENTVSLGGNNSYTGGTFFDNGTTIVGNDANLGNPSGQMLWSGGAARFTGSVTNARPLGLRSSGNDCVIIVNTNQTVQLSGVSTNSNNEELRKAGPGSLVYTGSGILRLFVEEGTATLAGNAMVTNGNQFQNISGTNGITRLIVKDQALLQNESSAGLNIADGNNQTNAIIVGELLIQDNAVLSLRDLNVGKFLNATGRVHQTGGLVTNNNAGAGNWRLGGETIGVDTNTFGGYYLSGGSLLLTRPVQVGRVGGGELVVSGTGTMQATDLNAGTESTGRGSVLVNGGSVTLSANLNAPLLGKTGSLVVSNGGTLTASALVLGTTNDANSGSVTVGNNGTLTVGQISGSATARAITFNGGTLKANASNAAFLEGLTSATIGAGGLTVDSAGNDITINQNLTGAGGLTKAGPGTLTLNSQNYTGSTVVNGGTLGSTPLVTTTLGGGLTVNAGGTVAPGASIGKLLATGNAVLRGTAALEISRESLFSSDSDRLQSAGSIALGGALNVTFAGTHADALTVGSSFTLFQAAGGLTGGFTTVSLPPVDPVNGNTLTWNTNQTAAEWSIAVATTMPGGATPTPTNITYTVTSGQMVLDWPNGQGWILQGQTNALSAGLQSNWQNVTTNSPYTNLFAAPTVFYRLIYTNAP